MKRYKNQNNEIYAYEDDVSEELLNQRIKELGLTPISDEEASRLLEPKIDEQDKQLAQIEAIQMAYSAPRKSARPWVPKNFSSSPKSTKLKPRSLNVKTISVTPS